VADGVPPGRGPLPRRPWRRPRRGGDRPNAPHAIRRPRRMGPRGTWFYGSWFGTCRAELRRRLNPAPTRYFLKVLMIFPEASDV
jgi:hypothetical protein